MPKVHFIDRCGLERVVETDVDVSVMHVAVANNISGIAGECDGCCLCSTCHALIDRTWLGRLDYPSSNEVNMLDHIPDSRSNSRLTCKIWMTEALDGLIVRTL